MKRFGLKTASGLGFLLLIALGSCTRTTPFGLSARIATKPYLNMPAQGDGPIPLLLSQTGVFSDTATA